MRMQQKTTDTIPAPSELRPGDAAVVADVRARTPRILDHARGGNTDYRTAYLWLDAGQSWPFLRTFTPISDRALCGWLLVVAACCFWAMILTATGSTRTAEATFQMERLAEKLESTTALPAETTNAIARIIGQPWYDCRHVGCSAQLSQRNRTARTRLENLLVSKGPDLSAKKARAAAAEVRH
jgi:hypothetical protein